ncbi:MAG: ATP-binding protein [Clostridia bacterium]|jgi:DNA polymerase-3 subunit delta'|nr:DNA polymerase III subunit delta' [Clostridiaceae bacterium]
MALKSFIGQKKITDKLRRALSLGTLSHSYLFSGPEGIGKKTLARAFASELVCTSPDTNGPCGNCNACKMFRAGIPTDYFWLQPEGDHVSVDDIRNIQSDIVIRPMYSERKIYVITGGDTMTVQAQNCLLKTLEEPPGYAVIILLAEKSESLLPTVMSRVIHYELEKYTKEDLSAILAQNDIRISPEFLNAVYGYSEGVPGKAMDLIRSEDFVQMREDMIRLILELIGDKLNIIDWANYFENYKEKFAILLNILQLFYRDALMIINSNKNSIINADKEDIAEKIAKSLDGREIIRNIQHISETQVNIKRNANYRLALENMLLNLTEE